MKKDKSQIQNIVIHTISDNNIVEKINEFHVEIIEQKLSESDLTKSQKLSVINGIMENIKNK